ncbi:hypothetical protein LAZ67_3004596 [Cordylochernes scorpioides]|uniref:Uncharacterized protein n=1 Tax=Cordylochernes scorpioides TaxID=51811 RepID=A0ABY6KAC5_9ARAC|nr:hypothetical protein LAZ67_3004596 [Cordylochernes scorpioides]
MKGRRYATFDEIKTASKEELKKILKNDFLKCFEDWKNRWHKCIISHGDYFEWDKIACGGKFPLKLPYPEICPCSPLHHVLSSHLCQMSLDDNLGDVKGPPECFG